MPTAVSSVLESDLFHKPGDERTVLSYCFKSVDYFYDLTAKLTERDFLSPEHQLLFAMLNGFINDGVTTLDLSMVINQAQNNGLIDLIGGVGYVQSIANIQSAPENFSVYVNNVLEASTKYQTYVALTHHLNTVKENAQSGISGAELISKVEANMLDMSSISMLNEDPIKLGDDLDQFIADRKDKKIIMTGLSTGFPILDRQIDGLIPGTLMVVAARKKMGKSAFLTNSALFNAFKSDIPVLYIDTELTFSEWQTRALSIMSGIKERDIKHGGYSDDQLRRLEHAKNIIQNGKIYHKYMPGYSVDKVVSLCKKYKLKEDIGLIIFDYLKEPDLSTTDGNRKEYQLLGDITTKLKDLAGILNVPVLTAVQLNRQNDIADSDRIARFGDIISIWGLRTEEEKEKCGPEGGQYKLVIKDTRRGGSTSTEGIGFWFFKSRITIREVGAYDQYFINSGEEVTNVDDLEDEFYIDEVEDELS